jgi:hypothetical protein
MTKISNSKKGAQLRRPRGTPAVRVDQASALQRPGKGWKEAFAPAASERAEGLLMDFAEGNEFDREDYQW